MTAETNSYMEARRGAIEQNDETRSFMFDELIDEKSQMDRKMAMDSLSFLGDRITWLIWMEPEEGLFLRMYKSGRREDLEDLLQAWVEKTVETHGEDCSMATASARPLYPEGKIKDEPECHFGPLSHNVWRRASMLAYDQQKAQQAEKERLAKPVETGRVIRGTRKLRIC